MEEITKIKIELFTKAVNNFNESLMINLDNYSEIEKDLMKNGQIQKFEFSIELMWKTIKDYINDEYGLDVASPKSVLKTFFEKGHLDYEWYEKAIKAIDDRNKLSHIYKEEMFQSIYSNLKEHQETLNVIIKNIKQS
jgi:nucleotidyltransferase substrate binding protein (TIGR01987 family)